MIWVSDLPFFQKALKHIPVIVSKQQVVKLDSMGPSVYRGLWEQLLRLRFVPTSQFSFTPYLQHWTFKGIQMNCRFFLLCPESLFWSGGLRRTDFNSPTGKPLEEVTQVLRKIHWRQTPLIFISLNRIPLIFFPSCVYIIT